MAQVRKHFIQKKVLDIYKCVDSGLASLPFDIEEYVKALPNTRMGSA